MEKKWLTIPLIALVAFTVGAVSQTDTKKVSAQYEQTKNYLSVNGRGKVLVQPDTAIVSLGIQTQGSTSKEAQEKNTLQTKQVTDALITLSIDRKDIQTEWYNIYPQYDYSEGGNNKITGYQADHNLNVTVKNLERVSAVLDKATEVGANSVTNVSYSVQNKESALDQARELAAKDAKAKAEKLGKIFSFTLGKVTSVNEYSDSGISSYADGKGGMGGGMNVVPGDIEVWIDLNVSYEIL